MADNGKKATTPMDAIVAQLREAQVAALATENEHRFALSQAEGERKKLDKMIELAEGRPQRRMSSRTSAQRSKDISSEYVEKLLVSLSETTFETIEGMPEGSFTWAMVRDNVKRDFSESTAERALTVLRDQGYVRLAGKKVMGKGKAHNVYALVNAQGERALSLVGSDVSDG